MKKQFIRNFTIGLLFIVFTTSESQTSPGFLNSNATVCSGNNNGNIFLTGYSGSIVRWEFSNSPNGPWSVMLHTSNSYNYVNLLQNTYFRAVVQMTGYPESASNSVLITCSAPSIAGTASAATLQCSSALGTASISGQTGNIPIWQISTNNWITSSNFGSPNSTFVTLPAVTGSAAVRAVIKNGACPSVFSNTINIFSVPPSLGGNINGNSSVCSGTNLFTLALNGYAGTLQQWESSSNSNGPFSGIANSSTNTTTIVNQLQNTYYRARVQSGNCPVAYSNTFLVTADSPSSGGFISGTNSVCAGNNTVNLQLSSNNGVITQWEFSTNSGTSWQVLSNSTNSLTLYNISTSRIFRCRVQNGVCPSVASSQFVLSAYPTPTANFVANNVCKNSSCSFSNTSLGATSYLWNFGDGSTTIVSIPSHTYTLSGNFTVNLKVSNNVGCTDSTNSAIISYPLPSAAFVSADTICSGSSIIFTDNSTISSGLINGTLFYFPGAPLTSTVNPSTHAFLQAGIFPVKLTVASNFGCLDSIIRFVTVFPRPLASISIKNNCLGDKLSIANNSSANAGQIFYRWTFGNGDSANVSVPQYTYSAAGNYSCALICVTDKGCSDTAIAPVIVHPQVQPALSFPSNNCYGLPVQFTVINSNTVPVKSTKLFYGDGDSTTSMNSIHNFSFPGNYSAKLIITSDSGCVKEIQNTVSIFPAPVAAFNVPNICRNDSALFQNLSVCNGAGCGFKWKFSDSSKYSGNAPKHLYTKAGIHKTSLTVTTDKGCKDSLEKNHQVFELPLAGFMSANLCQYATQTFTNTSVTSNGILKHTWSFGDGTASTEKSPNKSYNLPGFYKVELISANSDGCSDTASQIVQIYEQAKVDFSSSDICLNEKARFTNRSKSSTATFESWWSFGDGNNTNTNSPEHNYQHAGKYTVRLVASGFNLCADSVEKEILVHSLPKVQALADSVMDLGASTTMLASGALSYSWFPQTALENPFSELCTVTPSFSSKYYVIGQNEFGCVNMDSIYIHVKDEHKVIPFNILTPDNNGQNDTWIIGNIEAYPDNEVVIYNTWNELVYRQTSYANQWTGTNMRGEILPEGTYYYFISFAETDAKYSGYITLLRHKE